MSRESTNHGASADGTIAELDGRPVLRFERRYPHPIERVWGALTQPAQLARWFCGTSEVDIDLVEGGIFSLRIVGPPELLELIGGGDPTNTATILRVQPPLVFEHSFAGDAASFARYELEPDGDGTVLNVTVAVPSREAAVEGNFLIGFHMSLDALGQVLDGVPAPWTRNRFDELVDYYAANG